MDEQAGLENRSPSRDRGFESHPLRHNDKSQKTERGATIPTNGRRRGWDANGGSEGGAPPSRGDRRDAPARGGWPPSGSTEASLGATSNPHPLRHNTKAIPLSVELPYQFIAIYAGGMRTGVLKGVRPLHGVTGATRRREGAWPPSGSTEASSGRLRIPTPSAIISRAVRLNMEPSYRCIAVMKRGN